MNCTRRIFQKLTFVSFILLCTFQVHGLDATINGKSTTGSTPSETSKSKTQETGISCQEDDTPCIKDKFGYDAIQALHHLLDDDQNGNVDQSESDEFLRDELQYTDGFERQKTFHGNDKLISVEDLWKAWKGSEVYNWTSDQVLEWLECSVELPQYIEVFTAKAVDGTALPRLAYHNSNFFTQTLGIKNAVHKQKISVKAMDAVLFGAPKKAHNYIKDIFLVASLIIALGGCWFAYIHHHYSQNHVKKMMKELESLQRAEDALQELQEKLTMAEEKQNSVSKEKQRLEDKYKDEIDAAKKEAERLKEARQGNNLEESLKLAEEELAQVRAALRRSEKELELQEHWSVPKELQAWLQLTHELEHAHYMAKRSAAEIQLAAARDSCDKIRKRNKAFLGSLRMAHGNSLDDIDQRIVVARNAFEEVKQDLQERLQRWHTIESLCAFPIMSNPGLPTLKQILHKDSGQSGRSGAVLGAIGVEEGDEDLPPAYPTVVHSTSNGTGRPRAHSAYQPSSQPKPNLPRLRSAPCSGSTGSLSRITSNGSSRHSESPSPSDHSSVGPVSFHLGENSQHHLHHHHHLPALSGVVAPPLASSTISESPTESVEDQSEPLINPLSVSMDDRIINRIPHSQSYSITPTSSETNLQGISTSFSTSALKKLAVNGSSQSSGDKESIISEDKKDKKKKGSIFKMLRKGNKTKTS